MKNLLIITVIFIMFAFMEDIKRLYIHMRLKQINKIKSDNILSKLDKIEIKLDLIEILYK